MQSSGFCRCLLGPVSDNVLINRVSKERALHQAIKGPCNIYCITGPVQNNFWNQKKVKTLPSQVSKNYRTLPICISKKCWKGRCNDRRLFDNPAGGLGAL